MSPAVTPVTIPFEGKALRGYLYQPPLPCRARRVNQFATFGYASDGMVMAGGWYR